MSESRPAPSHEPPSDDDILDQRARKLAQASSSSAERVLTVTVAVVSASGEQFGLPVGDLREITTCPTVARLPGLPAWMPGMVQTRGDLVTVVDVGGWFGSGPSASTPYLAVLERAARCLGLAVEGVGGFRPIYEDEIAQFLDGQSQSQGLPIWATTRDLLTILDPARLFESAEITVGAGGAVGQAAARVAPIPTEQGVMSCRLPMS